MQGELPYQQGLRKVIVYVERVKEDDKFDAGRGLYVQVTHNKMQRRVGCLKKNDHLLIGVGVLIVLGPQENKRIIPAFKTQETRVQTTVNVCQLAGVHVSVFVRRSR